MLILFEVIHFLGINLEPPARSVSEDALATDLQPVVEERSRKRSCGRPGHVITAWKLHWLDLVDCVGFSLPTFKVNPSFADARAHCQGQKTWTWRHPHAVSPGRDCELGQSSSPKLVLDHIKPYTIHDYS